MLQLFDSVRRRAIEWEGKNSSWLNVLPVARYHYDLSLVEFRDALALRYHRSLLKMPAFCDGCGAPTCLEHALDCRKGGLIIQRHNEVRDSLGNQERLMNPIILQHCLPISAFEVCGSHKLRHH